MGKVTRARDGKKISKPFKIEPDKVTTQYRNRAVHTEVRTIVTYDSGYTSSKRGWATASFPGPPSGWEYVRIVSGPRINNGACYGSVSASGFSAHSGFMVRAQRTTGSSCRNSRYTAAADVEMRTTKYTAWHNTKAEADAEFPGTVETRSTTTPGKKLIKIVVGDAFPFTTSGLSHIGAGADIHNTDQYYYMPHMDKAQANGTGWFHLDATGELVRKYKSQPSAGFYYIYISDPGAPNYIDVHYLTDKKLNEGGKPCIFKQLEDKGEIDQVKTVHFNAGTKEYNDRAKLNFLFRDFVIEMSNGKWYLCNNNNIVEKVMPKELTFRTFKNLIAVQNDSRNDIAPITTDGFRRVGCVWYPGAPDNLYNRSVGYGSGHHWPTALEHSNVGTFGGAHPSYVGPIREGQIVRMKVSSFRVPQLGSWYNKPNLNDGMGGVYETIIYWKKQGGQHYFWFSTDGCIRRNNGGDRMHGSHTGSYGVNTSPKDTSGNPIWYPWNSMSKYHGWVELYNHWIIGGREVFPSIALNGDSLYLGGYCLGLQGENLTFFIVDMAIAEGNDTDVFDDYVPTFKGE